VTPNRRRSDADDVCRRLAIGRLDPLGQAAMEERGNVVGAANGSALHQRRQSALKI
jgi:hypothetical protein